MRFEVLKPGELCDRDLARWSELRCAGGLKSAFFSPDWVRECARVDGPDRRLARVAVLRDGNDAVAFMPARVSRFAAQPVGAPMCDYQGVAMDEGVDFCARAAVKALGVGRLDFDTQVAGQPAMAAFLRGRKVSHVVDLSGGFDGYMAERKSQGSEVLRDCAKKRRKMEREMGAAVFAVSADPADFESLLAWKRERYVATGQTDIFATPWPRELLDNLWRRPMGEIHGKLFTLHVGGRLAAAHYALSDGRDLHAWFISHNEAFSRYSPGVMLIADILRWAADQGMAEFDLGTGAYSFKQRLANRGREVAHGYVGRPSASAAVRAAAYGVREIAETLPLGRASAWPGKAMRRFDVWRGLTGSFSFAK